MTGNGGGKINDRGGGDDCKRNTIARDVSELNVTNVHVLQTRKGVGYHHAVSSPS